MVQLCVRRADRLPVSDLLVVDETHHALASTWQELFATWPKARVLGVTATPERLDGRGLGEVFGTVVLGPSVPDLIGMGHLAAFDYYTPGRIADLSDVGVRAGDFARDALTGAMDRPAITGMRSRITGDFVQTSRRSFSALRSDTPECRGAVPCRQF